MPPRPPPASRRSGRRRPRPRTVSVHGVRASHCMAASVPGCESWVISSAAAAGSGERVSRPVRPCSTISADAPLIAADHRERPGLGLQHDRGQRIGRGRQVQQPVRAAQVGGGVGDPAVPPHRIVQPEAMGARVELRRVRRCRRRSRRRPRPASQLFLRRGPRRRPASASATPFHGVSWEMVSRRSGPMWPACAARPVRPRCETTAPAAGRRRGPACAAARETAAVDAAAVPPAA